MTFVRTLVSIVVLSIAAMAASTWAAADREHDAHHPAPPAAIQGEQAQPSSQGMSMGADAMSGQAGQMKAMRQMHEEMLAAKTPKERNALMAQHMKLMQSGMNMMDSMGGGMSGSMGADAAASKSGDMSAHLSMMEKRMDMMQSMMQMMMDRMQAAPAAK